MDTLEKFGAKWQMAQSATKEVAEKFHKIAGDMNASVESKITLFRAVFENFVKHLRELDGKPAKEIGKLSTSDVSTTPTPATIYGRIQAEAAKVRNPGESTAAAFERFVTETADGRGLMQAYREAKLVMPCLSNMNGRMGRDAVRFTREAVTSGRRHIRR